EGSYIIAALPPGVSVDAAMRRTGHTNFEIRPENVSRSEASPPRMVIRSNNDQGFPVSFEADFANLLQFVECVVYRLVHNNDFVIRNTHAAKSSNVIVAAFE